MGILLMQKLVPVRWHGGKQESKSFHNGYTYKTIFLES